MHFMQALWYLRSQGMVVEISRLSTSQGRFYKVYDPDSDIPPFWSLPKVICAFANLASVTEKNLKEGPHVTSC